MVILFQLWCWAAWGVILNPWTRPEEYGQAYEGIKADRGAGG
jgi:hypothetical protein